MTEVVVIGAGPYGLSVAAHLRHFRIPCRVFGRPMSMWQEHAPKGMTLKSDAFASSFASPGDGYPLQQFYRDTGRNDYSHIGHRVPAQTLVEYGHEFQRRQVGEVEEAEILEVARQGDGFDVKLDTGESVAARKVVVAVGLLALRHIPDILAGLPASLLSHSSAHHDLAKFQGRRVVVVGGGQSACELAALLNEAGARVTLLARRPIHWYDPDNEDQPNVRRSTWQRIRRPNFGLGPGWRTWFWSEMPYGFSYLSQAVRHDKAYSAFGPAGSGWTKNRVEGVVPILTGRLCQVQDDGAEARLSVASDAGDIELVADHVIAATGYRSDTRLLSFLDPLQHGLRSIDGTPVLNRSFEASVRGLYFAGYLSAATFGPSMRFIYGAGFAARRISGHLSHLRDSRPPVRQFGGSLPIGAGAAV